MASAYHPNDEFSTLQTGAVTSGILVEKTCPPTRIARLVHRPHISRNTLARLVNDFLAETATRH